MERPGQIDEEPDPLLASGLRLAYRQDDVLAVPRVTTRSPVALAGNRLGTAAVGDAKRFEVIREIARGGMGKVLEVFDHDLGRRIAVKVLHDHLRQDRAAHLRLLSEAQVTGQLHHPGVPAVHDVSRTGDGSPSIAMEHVDGETLATRLARRTGPEDDRSELLRIFTELVRIVAHAHGCGVVHRDIKPANVMIGGLGEVLLLDWGVARILDEADGSRTPNAAAPTGSGTRDGAVIGSPGYMAPEQLRGDSSRATPAADVFALGSILCEILLGETALQGAEDDTSTLDAIQDRIPTEVAEERLRAILSRAIAADPGDRDADAAALHTALIERERDLALQSAAAERERSRAEGRAAAERRLRRWTSIGAVMVVAVMAIGAAVWYSTERRRSDLAAIQRANVAAACDEARAAIEAAVGQVEVSGWRDAVAAAERARQLYDRGAPSELGSSVNRLAERAGTGLAAAVARQRLGDENRTLVAALEAAVYGGRSDAALAAFRAHVGDPLSTPPETLAGRITERGFGAEFASRLDLWAMSCDAPLVPRLLDLASRLDPDTTRIEIRAAFDDRPALDELARSLDPRQHAPHTTHLLVRDQLQRRGVIRTKSDRGVDTRSAGDLQLAADLLRAGLSAHPDAVGLHWERAELRLRHTGFLISDVARSAAEAVTSRRPDLIFGWRLLGDALVADGSLAESVKWLRRFAEARPADPGAKLRLATVLARLGRRDETERLLSELPGPTPGDADGWCALGSIREVDSDRAGAQEAYARAAASASEPRHVLSYAQALLDAGALEPSLTWFRRAVSRWPEDPNSRYALGRAHEKAADRQAASEQASQLARIADRHGSVYLSPKTAADVYCLALDLDPGIGFGVVGFKAEATFAALGRHDEILEYWRRRCIESGQPYAWFLFAASLHHAGRFAEAAHAYERALSAHESPPFYFHAKYFQALMELGRFDEARRAVDAAIRAFPKPDPDFMAGPKRAIARLIELRDGAAPQPTQLDQLSMAMLAFGTGRFADAVAEFRKAFRRDTGGTYGQVAAGAAIALASVASSQREELLREALEWTRRSFERSRHFHTVPGGESEVLYLLLPLVTSGRFAPVRDPPRTLIMSPALEQDWDRFWHAVRTFLEQVARR